MEPGNGQVAKFWMDAWLGQGFVLKDFLLAEISEIELLEPVAQFVSVDSSWDTNKFAHLLPDFVVQYMLQSGLPGLSSSGDSIS
ncbi:putative Polynucleotidyl transferase [Sesbania bispinosa]|nr:putative Polynucleotidyl transferase [Sesbania bispinosa]